MRARVIGEVSSDRPGPTVLCVGSLHGTEPAGARAAERLFERVQRFSGSTSGHLLAVRGNLRALETGRRFIDRDLNRIWQPPVVDAVLGGGEPPEPAVEYEELRELAGILGDAVSKAEGPVWLLDLHSTSSESPPFFWLIPSPGAEALLPQYGLPIVYDPQTRITGTMAQWVASLGHQVIIAEGGQHESPAAVDHHEAILWITLDSLGCLTGAEARAEVERSRTLLRAARGQVPLLHLVGYHHKISEADGFRMRPGFRTFQPVEAGEVLADDRRGEIRAPESGRILMPLYKPPCEDGFLIVREATTWPHQPA